jgi:hypothetical protein
MAHQEHLLFKIMRLMEETEKIDGSQQSKFRTGVGMLLHLIKYSRPDLTNVIREFSKCMDGTKLAAHQEMFRVMKFVLDRKGLLLEVESYL